MKCLLCAIIAGCLLWTLAASITVAGVRTGGCPGGVCPVLTAPLKVAAPLLRMEVPQPPPAVVTATVSAEVKADEPAAEPERRQPLRTLISKLRFRK